MKKPFNMKSRIVRIPTELDLTIKNLAQKNGMRYADAAREIANTTNKLKNRKVIFKEIKF